MEAQWPLPEHAMAAYERFMEIARRENVTHISEGSLIDALKPIVEKAAASEPPG
jgi:hypothetical protein